MEEFEILTGQLCPRPIQAVIQHSQETAHNCWKLKIILIILHFKFYF